MIKTTLQCKHCKHYQNKQCLLFNEPIEENKFCYNYTESAYICELCGKHLVQQQVFYEQGKTIPWRMICGNCSSNITSCQTCTNSSYCSFNMNTSIKENPYIPQTIRQGNSIIQTQIKNPKRIELTCKKCKCFHNNICLKEDNTQCENYNCFIENW